MKNNNKNRKLNFIRRKNNFRLKRHIFANVFKFTEEFLSDVDFNIQKQQLEDCIQQTRYRLLKDLKITAKKYTVYTGYDAEDFLNGLVSVKITLIHH